MANPEHLAILKQGVEAWNRWTRLSLGAPPELNNADLRGLNLRGAELTGADLREADLTGAFLSFAYLTDADLSQARLGRSDLSGAFLHGANLSGADLRKADLRGAYLSKVDFTGADLTEAFLIEATMAGAILRGATLKGCHVYGVSAWDLEIGGATQADLVITPGREPSITVDNLEIAQFIYLLLNNENIRHVIDTITSKVVLILGRFSDERKAVLDAIRQELRHRDLTPVLFDFDKPGSKDMTGTVETLARMARFVVADLTDPSSIPHELATIVPFLRTTPVLSLRMAGSGGYSMFEDLQQAYDWVLETHEYKDGPSLIKELTEVIAPAEEKVKQLRGELDEGHQE